MSESSTSYETVEIVSEEPATEQPATEQPVKEQLAKEQVAKEQSATEEPTIVTAFITRGLVVDPKGKWKDGLCDCFNNMYPSMCCVIFTPTVYLIHLYQGFYGFSKCNGCLWLYIGMNIGAMISMQYTDILSRSFLFLFNVITLAMAAYIRTAVRHKGKIPGGDCEDACITGFLFPCSLAQTGRTLYSYDKICDTLKASGDANYSRLPV